jgi:hypothetical protein
MKYFISYVYLTKSNGRFFFGNDLRDINSEITPELIEALEKEYELKHDARLERVKILYLTKL